MNENVKAAEQMPDTAADDNIISDATVTDEEQDTLPCTFDGATDDRENGDDTDNAEQVAEEPMITDDGNTDAPAADIDPIQYNHDAADDEPETVFAVESDEDVVTETDASVDNASSTDSRESDEGVSLASKDEDSDNPALTITEDTNDGEEVAEAAIGNNEAEEPVRMIDRVFDFVELFIFSLVAVLVATTFLFRHSIVEGSSMEQTLFENEHLIISNLFYEPERGDIIVCEDYTTSLHKPIVKRVIGLPGDRVEVYPTGEVFINGEKITEPYVYVDFYTPQLYVDVIVPEGEIFVMGDHRNLSTDSRELGTVDIDSILGKVLIRFYPFDKFGTVN